MAAVRDGLLVRLQTLGLYGRDGLRSDIQDQGVDQLDVVAAAGLGAGLERRSEIGDERDRRTGFQVRVQLLGGRRRTVKYKTSTSKRPASK